MYKDWVIPRALHVCSSLLVPSSKVVAASYSDIEEINFPPLSYFPSKLLVSSISESYSSNLLAHIGP